MFTGLVEGLATVESVIENGPGVDIAINPSGHLDEIESTKIGDSIAINGCCLTVIRIEQPQADQSLWVFQAGSETLSKTNLGTFKPGTAVNLERSLRPTDRMGGHFVQGHVDAIGHVDAVETEGEWTNIWFKVPAALTRQMVPKGSVTVDGVSLTLVNVEAERFSVALIPHTLEVTTLGNRSVGETVNIETDIIGKYMEKMLTGITEKDSAN
ncbi:riboflavin synthase [Thalassoglobus polymorphus]|uniref:Riboflavin synthase n=1 Tax=Thalassoglobus polymorphus TaxID=2527994 RepID=A0A517QRF5_9PLAN|nr:riboflavin synthase [Thalassoglobus polymorphus]QDT34211.1 Riboflavin synthase [Thalassoglobus polymorphus]